MIGNNDLCANYSPDLGTWVLTLCSRILTDAPSEKTYTKTRGVFETAFLERHSVEAAAWAHTEYSKERSLAKLIET
jgi:hypothetical protein